MLDTHKEVIRKRNSFTHGVIGGVWVPGYEPSVGPSLVDIYLFYSLLDIVLL